MIQAITRQVSPGIERCELTHQVRQAIDYEAAVRQHRAYRDCLADLGCDVHTLPADPDLPDSVFVEDIAIVLDELAIITHPGAESRRGEIDAIESALAPFRRIERIEPPATLDGGDLLRIGRTLFVGVTQRSNAAGLNELIRIVSPIGYEVQPVPVSGCLHLKSGCTWLGEDALLINRDWVDAAPFADLHLIEVDPAESGAANGLLVNGTIVHPAEYPRTRRLLEAAGFTVRAVDNTELAKAEGGVTCCSLLFGR